MCKKYGNDIFCYCGQNPNILLSTTQKEIAVIKVLKKLFFVNCQDQVNRLDAAAKEIVNIFTRDY